MINGRADFTVLGSSPLARLIAGLLAHRHDKAVVIVGDSQSAFRLPRAVDLSIGAITRPETWALLSMTAPETRKLLAGIGGKSAMSRIDPVLFTETAGGREALAYIRNVAAGFGHAIERLGATALGPGREGFVLRDALYLHRPPLEPVLDTWLDRLKVTRCLDSETAVVVQSDGSARITSGDNSMDADATIVVDDAAILNHIPAQALDRLFRLERGATILTEPTLPLIAPVMLEIDRGLCLTQTASHGVIAISPGDLDRLGHRLGAILATHRHIRRTGQSTHPLLSSRDGAPIVGRLDEAGPLLVGGFGSIGAFIAPAIARFIAGQSPAAEASYFAARAPSRPLMPSIVADYAPQPPMAETAA